MKRINILHISDLHYEEKNKNDIIKIFEILSKDVINYKQRENIHFIVFSGDLAGSGKVEEYNQSFDLINNLLEKIELSWNQVFFTPGNHDVDRSQIDSIIENDLANKLDTIQSIDNYITQNLYNLDHHKQLKNYFDFIDVLENKYQKNSSVFYSTYLLDEFKIPIGIACINSSWRAQGGSSDKGRLIISKKQIELAFEDIKEADIKIAVLHHPLLMLQESIKETIQSILYDLFDIIIWGHNHKEYADYYSSFNTNIITSMANSLYKGPDNINGYSIIALNLENETFKIIVHVLNPQDRIYNDVTNNFTIKSLEGKLNLKSKNDPVRVYHADVYNRFLDAGKEVLLPAISNEKSIKDIFVDPLIANTPLSDDIFGFVDNSLVSINDIIENDINYIIFGKKESGKSTLLNYFCIHIIEKHFKEKILPIYINYSDIKAKVNEFDNYIMRYSQNYFGISNPDKLFEYKVIFLVDDFKYATGQKQDFFLNFVKKYEKCKFIITSTEEIRNSIGINIGTILPSKFETLFIRPFTKELVQNLTKKLQSDIPETEKVSEAIYKTVVSLHLPRTPFIFTLIITLYPKTDRMQFINKASLLELFIDDLLEKSSVVRISNVIFDYRKKEYYLEYIAHYMHNKEQFTIKKSELEQVTIEYIKSFRSDVEADDLIEYMIKRKIFTLESNNIMFKCRSFFEYFFAKRMIEDQELYNIIVDGNEYLKYSNELEILSGLQRTNLSLMCFLEDKLVALKNKLKENGTMQRIDPFTIDFTESFDFEFFKELNIEDIEKILESKELHQEKEELLNQLDLMLPDNDQIIEKKQIKETFFVYLSTLILLTQIHKNCELIQETEKRKRILKNIIQNWAIVCYLTISMLKEFLEIDSYDLENIIPEISDSEKLEQALPLLNQSVNKINKKINELQLEEDEKQHKTQLIKLCIPTGLDVILKEIFITTDIANIINEISVNEFKDPMEELIFVLLSTDFEDKNKLSKLKQYIKDNKKNKYSLSTVLFRIIVHSSMKSRNPNQELKRIVKDIVLALKLESSFEGKRNNGNYLNIIR